MIKVKTRKREQDLHAWTRHSHTPKIKANLITRLTVIPHQGLRSLGGPHPSRTAPQGPTYEGMATPGPFGPCNFPFPILVSQHLGALGGFLGLLAAPPVVGLHPTGLQGLDCPASRPKSPESATEMSMGDPTCLKRCPGTTPHRAWKTSLDRPREQPSLPRGRGRKPVIGQSDVRWAQSMMSG